MLFSNSLVYIPEEVFWTNINQTMQSLPTNSSRQVNWFRDKYSFTSLRFITGHKNLWELNKQETSSTKFEGFFRNYEKMILWKLKDTEFWKIRHEGLLDTEIHGISGK